MAEKKEDHKDNNDQEELKATYSQKELERQLERFGLFTHNGLSNFAQRINKIEALLLGLVDELSFRNFISKYSLRSRAEMVEKDTMNDQKQLFAGVAIRDDGFPRDEVERNEVNCEERLHICKAACCKLNFALSIEEIEAGDVKWDLGMPYHIRQDKAGYCSHLETEKKCCTIHDKRPWVCRRYTCKNDGRIWKDFDKMILNDEWTSENLKSNEMTIRNIKFVPVKKTPPPTHSHNEEEE